MARGAVHLSLALLHTSTSTPKHITLRPVPAFTIQLLLTFSCISHLNPFQKDARLLQVIPDELFLVFSIQHIRLLIRQRLVTIVIAQLVGDLLLFKLCGGVEILRSETVRYVGVHRVRVIFQDYMGADRFLVYFLCELRS